MPANERIAERRKELGLSLAQLADRLRPYWPTVEKQVVYKIEHGKRNVAADEIPLFARALNCRPADLLDPPPNGSPEK